MHCTTGNNIVVRFASVQTLWFHALHVYSQKFLQCFWILTALLAKVSYRNSLAVLPHRPNNLSPCNVKHKGVEEPIYRCCTSYALRRYNDISGYLMSLLICCEMFYELWIMSYYLIKDIRYILCMFRLYLTLKMSLI